MFNSYIAAYEEPTKPELIVHVPEAGRVVLPVPEELQFPALASDENLGTDNQTAGWL